MKEQSHESQKPRLKSNRRLQAMGILIDSYFASGELDDYLKLRDENGEYPVVTALDSETLYLLNQRVTAAGGMANVFIDRGDHAEVIYAAPYGKKDSGLPMEGAEDLSEGWENGDATVAAFLDYLKLRPNGVVTPQELKMGPRTIMNMGGDVDGLNPDKSEVANDRLLALC